MRELTWRCDGVFLPPKDADVLIATAEGASLLYVDRVSTPGTMVVTSLDPIVGAQSDMRRTGERLMGKLVPAIRELFVPKSQLLRVEIDH